MVVPIVDQLDSQRDYRPIFLLHNALPFHRPLIYLSAGLRFVSVFFHPGVLERVKPARCIDQKKHAAQFQLAAWEKVFLTF